jgi:hypothetical protein
MIRKQVKFFLEEVLVEVKVISEQPGYCIPAFVILAHAG